MKCSIYIDVVQFAGVENYENQMKYGKKTFQELEYVNTNGFAFEGILHRIDVISCCDWKAAACIEGFLMAYFI